MKTRCDLPALFSARGYETAVEVGVFRGQFSRVILQGWGGVLVMVDAWRQLPDYIDIRNCHDLQHESNMRDAVMVASSYPGRARIVRGLSVEAAGSFEDESVDAVYIDANHSKDAVLADLEAWLPKVKRGGVISGHDYIDGIRREGVFGVKSAVLQFFGRQPDIVTDEPWPTWLVEVP